MPQAKKNKIKCSTPGCKKIAKHGHKCHSCTKRKYAQRHPIQYAFNTLKQNAKRRGKDFSLTFEQFNIFCLQTGYHNLKGITPGALSIDRINSHKGYSIDNIQILTFSQNSMKQNKDQYFTQLKQDCKF